MKTEFRYREQIFSTYARVLKAYRKDRKFNYRRESDAELSDRLDAFYFDNEFRHFVGLLHYPKNAALYICEMAKAVLLTKLKISGMLDIEDKVSVKDGAKRNAAILVEYLDGKDDDSEPAIDQKKELPLSDIKLTDLSKDVKAYRDFINTAFKLDINKLTQKMPLKRFTISEIWQNRKTQTKLYIEGLRTDLLKLCDAVDDKLDSWFCPDWEEDNVGESIKLNKESEKKVSDLIENSPGPTEAMKELFKNNLDNLGAIKARRFPIIEHTPPKYPRVLSSDEFQDGLGGLSGRPAVPFEERSVVESCGGTGGIPEEPFEEDKGNK